MGKFFIAAVLFSFFGLAFAQASTAEVSNAVFERVFATPMDSCHHASIVLDEDLSQFDYTYCGVIGDTFTSVNQRWTTGIFQVYGYAQAGRWEFHSLGQVFYPIEGYVGLFSNNYYISLVALGIINYHGRDATVIVLAFNRIN